MFQYSNKIDRDKSSENDARHQRARSSRMNAWQASIDRAEKRRLERERAKQEAALQAQRDAAVAARDRQQQKNQLQTNAQRSSIALGAANVDYQNQTRLNDQERRAIRERDKRLNQFDTEQTRQKNQDLRERDQRQFDYTMAENDQQFINQMDRDAAQNGYATYRDMLQNDATLKRDAFQYGLDSRRQAQQQRDTLQRDLLQGGLQEKRDILQNQFQSERDSRMNIFDTQRDMRRQQFEQQNFIQRETADVAAKWQEQIQQARAAGMDFSPAQQQKMKQMDAVFREKVLNGDLSEDLKLRAGLEHQKQLAAIIPENKVSTPDNEISQQFYEHPKLGLLKRTIDRNGNPDWQPMEVGMGEQAGMMRQQAQDQQRQAEAMSKKQLERINQFQNVYDQVESILDENDRPKFNTPEKVMAEAMRRFAPRERIYQMDGLPPLGQFLNPDEVPQPKGQQQSTQQPENPWRAALQQRQSAQTDEFSSMPKYGDYSPVEQKNAAPVILSTKPLSSELSQELSRLPGGRDLEKIREKHKSKSPTDQIMREATDIVIRSMIMNDNSDPDLPEALELLKRAGFTPR